MSLYTTRPLTTWPGGAMTRDRRRSPFRASWSATIELLERELSHLGARHVALELALREDEIRLDGLPRASARPTHPGVVISFDSRHGPLRYAVDAFTTWEDNLRAIALGLESLRRVDRYGMSSSGEQYRGWLALEAGQGGLIERGRALIVHHGSVAAALKATHPDTGGNPADFAAVQAAREADG